jgi:hypothetical protein
MERIVHEKNGRLDIHYRVTLFRTKVEPVIKETHPRARDDTNIFLLQSTCFKIEECVAFYTYPNRCDEPTNHGVSGNYFAYNETVRRMKTSTNESNQIWD